MIDTLVSIIIPAKNEELNIAKVLSHLYSSIRYTRYNCEVILVDNGSTDSTRAIAADYNCKVIVEPNASIAGLRNLGARKSDGNIIAFLDADCIVDEKWIELCVDRLSDEQIGIIGTRAVPDFSDANWLEEGWYALVSGVDIPDYPKWIGSSNIFLRREVFDEIGGFDENLETAEDVDLCQKVSLKYKICIEKRINTIHLRESKTVLQMFRREIWRGKSSIRQMLVSQSKASEIKSIAVPLLINFLCFFTLIGTFFNNHLKWSYIAIFIMPLAMMIYKKAVCNRPRDFKNAYCVGLIYLISRSIAIFQEVLIIIKLAINWVFDRYRGETFVIR